MPLLIGIILAIIGLISLALYRSFSASKKKQNGHYSIFELPTTMNLPNDEQNILELPPVSAANRNQNDNNLLQIPSLYPSQNIIEDESIIDVTDQTAVLFQEEEPVLTAYPAKIPPWPHFYVYSLTDLNSASNDQRSFYNYFKREFLRGTYLDLEGYTNYAFILMFDLVKDSLSHGDIESLEKQLCALEVICPKTRSYGQNLLIARMRAVGDYSGVERLVQSQDIYRYQPQHYDYWSLGKTYKKELGLNDEQVKILNKPSFSRSSFASIEYCCIVIIKLYLLVVPKLQVEYQSLGTSLDNELNKLADLVARKQFRFRMNSSNYRYAIETTITEFYSIIFKLCENAVREEYGHKRKLNVELNYVPALKEEIDLTLLSLVTRVIKSEVKQAEPPDEHTEIALNAQNTRRWKGRFQQLTSQQGMSSKEFLNEINVLAALNKKNPSVENIYFEASKFIAKQDKGIALTLYIHYLYQDLGSSKFDNKQLTKTIQKSLFKNNEQLHEFEKIVGQLINDRNLEAALSKIPQIYLPKRKPIVLDREAIRDVSDKHSGTVELLNEYLTDEFENEQVIIVAKEINSEEVQIDITQKNEVLLPTLETNVALSHDQLELLQLFVRSNFNISLEDAEDFAKSKDLFRNQLIESVNEACYELLDDILIEEENENYLMNESYYSSIIKI